MRVLIIGATGYIGAAVAERLHAAGHTIDALARTDEKAAQLRAKGYTPVLGDLRDPASLTQAAGAVDGVIYVAQLAFDPSGDFAAQMADMGQVQLAAVNALLAGLGTSGKPLITTSGTGAYGDTGDGVAIEETPTLALPMMAEVAASERRVLEASNVRGIVVRPGIVYGRGGGPVTMLMGMAQQMGSVMLAGEGDNLLSLVHVDDLADLYLLLLERAPAGTLVNAIAEPFVTQRAVLESISRLLGQGGQVTQVPPQPGMGYNIFARNMRVSGAKAKGMGWTPQQPNVLDDIEQGSYSVKMMV